MCWQTADEKGCVVVTLVCVFPSVPQTFIAALRRHERRKRFRGSCEQKMNSEILGGWSRQYCIQVLVLLLVTVRKRFGAIIQFFTSQFHDVISESVRAVAREVATCHHFLSLLQMHITSIKSHHTNTTKARAPSFPGSNNKDPTTQGVFLHLAWIR